jgi:hypothetical protein
LEATPRRFVPGVAIEDLALVRDRLAAGGQLSWQLLALLVVGECAGKQEAEQKHGCRDETGVEGVENDCVPAELIEGQLGQDGERHHGGDLED